jgi:hypothetical protein
MLFVVDTNKRKEFYLKLNFSFCITIHLISILLHAI